MSIVSVNESPFYHETKVKWSQVNRTFVQSFKCERYLSLKRSGWHMLTRDHSFICHPRLSTNAMSHPAFTPSHRASPHFGRYNSMKQSKLLPNTSLQETKRVMKEVQNERPLATEEDLRIVSFKEVFEQQCKQLSRHLQSLVAVVIFVVNVNIVSVCKDDTTYH